MNNKFEQGTGLTHEEAMAIRYVRDTKDQISGINHVRVIAQRIDSTMLFLDYRPYFFLSKILHDSCCRSELQSIQESLVTGQQEKVQLMKSLACLKVSIAVSSAE